MCGIYASVSKKGFTTLSRCQERLLRDRGPDHLGAEQVLLETQGGSRQWFSFTSTVLALRGGRVQPQPFRNLQTGSILCCNGEAWRIGQDPVAGNDGQVVFDLLLEASSAHKLDSESTHAVIEVLRSISGPFSFVFLDVVHNKMYFGRDRLGRRSLLYNPSGHPECMAFASVADPSNGVWSEVEADGVYLLSCDSNGQPSSTAQDSDDELFSKSILPLYRHPWYVTGSNSSVCKFFLPQKHFCITIWSDTLFLADGI